MSIRKCSYCRAKFPEEELEELEDEIMFCSDICYNKYYDGDGLL